MLQSPEKYLTANGERKYKLVIAVKNGNQKIK